MQSRFYINLGTVTVTNSLNEFFIFYVLDIDGVEHNISLVSVLSQIWFANVASS